MADDEAPLAAQALITIAGQGRRADDAIFGAVIADSAVVWPELLALARRDGAPRESRKSAVFWLSQAAGDAASHRVAGGHSRSHVPSET